MQSLRFEERSLERMRGERGTTAIEILRRGQAREGEVGCCVVRCGEGMVREVG